MAQRTIKVVDFDVNAIRRGLRSVKPRTLSYEEALEKLAPALRRRVDDGAAMEDLAAELSRHGISIAARRLRLYLDTGSLSEAPAEEPDEPETDEAFRLAAEAGEPDADPPQPE